MNSPRYAPAGLLVEHARSRVIIDGGLPAKPRITAWLVTDESSELIREIRKLAHAKGLEPRVASYGSGDLIIEPRPVVHTSHPTFGYVIRCYDKKIVWAPEFLEFPSWARGADLMFAEAAGWKRPILFRKRVGGHACVEQIARDAPTLGVKRLVYAHIGRPTIHAIDRRLCPEFGDFGADGDVYRFAEDGTFTKRKVRQP